ncbi:MAG: hypothetical protein J0I06_02415 [Planctomycetes bacterium]|nr:hypothetical protein [Planctomycetota bacterium]
MLRSLLSSPLALAALVALANAAKPVTVDDTAYLAYARHIATSPADPYGFTIFWWDRPEPAMTVLAPPVVPYWLACGVYLFGDSPALLKLWLFPFVWSLAWALRGLLVRFARGAEDLALPLLVLSPAVLPTVNLMLDVPAVALALASVELFTRARGRYRWPLALAAGAVAAFAMQAKYTAFVAPAAIAWYGLTHRRIGTAVAAVAVCAALFAGWELWLAEEYGRSHFWFHATATASSPPPEGRSKLSAFVGDKLQLVPALASYLGCLAVGAGLLAASALRVPRRWLAGVAVIWCVGFVLIAALPRRWMAINPGVTAGTVFWHASGLLWLATALGCAAVLLVRVKKGLGVRLRADSLFLVGWLALEVAAALALTPFPAARRVVGVTLVMGLLAARVVSRVRRINGARTPPRWVLALGAGAGVAVAAIDLLDAFPEKVCAELAADVVRDRPETSAVWYAGHWGFQHYCERAGMQPLVPGETLIRADDYVVLPVYPDDGFNRPYAGFEFVEPARIADEVAVLEWSDPLSAKTVPNFYGGIEPIASRDHPRLRVRVYRLRTEWAP